MKNSILEELETLMQSNNVTAEEIQYAVASRGYYTVETPILKYDFDFIKTVLIGAWDQVMETILK